jgi:hypothetical protein
MAFDGGFAGHGPIASRYFGEASNGILRQRVQEGRVDIGELKSLGEPQAPAK